MASEGGEGSLYELKIAALLHDVGKPEAWAHRGDPVWKARQRHHSHVLFSEDMILECFGERGRAIALVGRRHHNNSHYPDDCPVEYIEHVVHRADCMASNADRPERRSGKTAVRLSHPLSPLDSPVFVGPEKGEDELLAMSAGVKRVLKSVAHLVGIDNRKAYTELYKGLSRSGLAEVPADTRAKKSDHTLWDHLRLTTAFATCIYLDGGYKGKDDRYKDYSFVVLAGDTDRVGKFIHESRRLPDLVARSKIATNAIEEAVKVVEDALGPDCIVYKGGGNFLALSPLCESEKLEKAARLEFEKVTGERLSITVASDVANGGEIAFFFQKPSGRLGFNHVWRRVFDKVRSGKRGKVPRRPRDTGEDDLLCDVCLEEVGAIEDPSHRYSITENGERRPERLCVRCFSLRDRERKSGVWMEDYADAGSGLVALLKIDGDDVGDIIEGSMLEQKCGKVASPARLSSISRAIDHTCRELGKMIEENYGGRCIYAEGDDLLAVVKGSMGLKCVKESVEYFGRRMAGRVTMSAGVVLMKAGYPIYMALEALEQLLRNAKDYVEKNGSPKASIDFEVIYNVGLTKNDLDLSRRLEKREDHLSHRPCKINELGGLFRFLDSIESAGVRKRQAALFTSILALKQGGAFILPNENVKHATVVAKHLIGREHVDVENGGFLLRSIENGLVCDAYMLATRVYGKEGMNVD